MTERRGGSDAKMVILPLHISLETSAVVFSTAILSDCAVGGVSLDFAQSMGQGG